MNVSRESLENIDLKYSDIPDKYNIYDERKLSELKTKTFSNYQKTDVLNALQKSILDQKLEEACHWGAELLVSGHILEGWERLVMINSKFINMTNPNLSFYIWSRFVQQIQLSQDTRYNGDKILNIRNSQEARNHLTDIITVLTLSSKNKLSNLPKIHTGDFLLDNFESKLEAKNNYLITNLIKSEDPSEINVVVNELAYQLTLRVGNLDKALYWLNWILEWEKLNIKKNMIFNCGLRKRKYVKPQYYHDIIWLLWDVIFQEATVRGAGRENMNRQLIGLFKMYRYGFSTGNKKKKMILLVHAIHLLAFDSKIKWDTPVINNFSILIQANINTNFLYSDYKNKDKTNFQIKTEVLQVLNRTDYPSSTSSTTSSTTQKSTSQINDDLKKRFDYVNSAIIKQQTQPIRTSKFPPMKPTESPKEPYKNTEDILNQIQDLIRK
jgi:hypothetical protein